MQEGVRVAAAGFKLLPRPCVEAVAHGLPQDGASFLGGEVDGVGFPVKLVPPQGEDVSEALPEGFIGAADGTAPFGGEVVDDVLQFVYGKGFFGVFLVAAVFGYGEFAEGVFGDDFGVERVLKGGFQAP